MSIPFSCGQGNDTLLCLAHTATCVRAIQGRSDQCLCPNGYVNDFTFGHFPNCALPTWYLPAFFALTTVCMGYGMSVFVREVWMLKKRCRQICLLLMAALFCQWLHVLCVFISNGNYEASIFFLATYGIILVVLSYMSLEMLIMPMYAVLRRPPNQFLLTAKAAFLLISGSNAVVQFTMIGFAREADPGRFNFLCSLQMIFLGTAYPVVGLLIFVQAVKLERMIVGLRATEEAVSSTSPGGDKLLKFVVQLQSLKKLIRRMMINTIVLGFSITIFFLGSMPYQFVIWSLNVWTIWPNAGKICSFLRHRDGAKTASSTPTQPESRENNKISIQNQA